MHELIEVSYSKPLRRQKVSLSVEDNPTPISKCPHCGSTAVEWPEGRFDCGYSRTVWWDDYVGNYVGRTTACMRTIRSGVNWWPKDWET